MRRRAFLELISGALLLLAGGARAALPYARAPRLAGAPLEVRGYWPGSPPSAARVVLVLVRQVLLAGWPQLSDRQPERLRVENRPGGPPFIWLNGERGLAWIVVDIGPRDWCKLAYQFGHELGHVVCNSWTPDARPRNPCQWLEETLVESFSIRGLGKLAESWATDPPFPGNASFAGAIVRYRDDVLKQYRTLAAKEGASEGLTDWFRTYRRRLETNGGISGSAGAAVPAMLGELEEDPEALEALGALNRWPGRTGVPMDAYLRNWQRSCADIGASQRLPVRVKTMLLG